MVDIKTLLGTGCATTCRRLKKKKEAWSVVYAQKQKGLALSPACSHDTAACCLGKLWSRNSLLICQLIDVADRFNVPVHGETLYFFRDGLPALTCRLITDSYRDGQPKGCGAETRPFQHPCTKERCGLVELRAATEANDFNPCVPSKKVLKAAAQLLAACIEKGGVGCSVVATLCSRLEGCMMAIWRFSEPNDRITAALGLMRAEMVSVITGTPVKVKVKRDGFNRGHISMTVPAVRNLYKYWTQHVTEALANQCTIPGGPQGGWNDHSFVITWVSSAGSVWCGPNDCGPNDEASARRMSAVLTRKCNGAMRRAGCQTGKNNIRISSTTARKICTTAMHNSNATGDELTAFSQQQGHDKMTGEKTYSWADSARQQQLDAAFVDKVAVDCSGFGHSDTTSSSSADEDESSSSDGAAAASSSSSDNAAAASSSSSDSALAALNRHNSANAIDLSVDLSDLSASALFALCTPIRHLTHACLSSSAQVAMTLARSPLPALCHQALRHQALLRSAATLDGLFVHYPSILTATVMPHRRGTLDGLYVRWRSFSSVR